MIVDHSGNDIVNYISARLCAHARAQVFPAARTHQSNQSRKTEPHHHAPFTLDKNGIESILRDEVAAAAAPVAESNGGVWQMTDSSDGEVAVAEVNGNDDPSSSSESSLSESESNSSDSSGLGLGAAGHPAAGVGCVPAPGSAVELLPVDQLPSPAPQSLPSAPSTPSVQVPQPKIMASPYLLPGAAPGTFRRLCQPLLAKEVFWGDRIWQVLRGSSHPLKLLQPPQVPRWEMQCAGTGGELLGFEAFIIHTIYVV